jgi:hypothetical protein
MAPKGIVPFDSWIRVHGYYDRFVSQRIKEIATSPNVIGFSFYSEVELYGVSWNAESIAIPELDLVNRTTDKYLNKAYGSLTGIVIVDAFLIPEYFSISLHCIPIRHMRLFLDKE